MLTRRRFLASSAAAAAPRPRPNVLVFMTDQETALLPGPAELPNRRRLAAGAAHFRHAFANTPQCSPARASLLTGLEPHRAGVRTNVDGSSLGDPLSPSVPNVGKVFREAGWTTGYFGKWHLTKGSSADLTAFGFDHRFDGKDDAVSAAASAWIRQQKGPWLAWVSVLNPHDIYRIRQELERTSIRPGVAPPPTLLNSLDAKPAEQRQYVEKDQGAITADFDQDHWLKYRSYYLTLVERTDALLGQVLDAVGDLSNTIVVYTSDHGDNLGAHGLPFKGPFLYEPLIRVPLLIRAPGRIRARLRDELVTHADIAPTIAGLAGVSWPAPVDGADLTRAQRRDAVFLEYFGKQKWVNPIRAIRTRRWKLNAYRSGSRELYDIAADPGETRDLSKSPAHTEILRRLEARLDRWWRPAD